MSSGQRPVRPARLSSLTGKGSARIPSAVFPSFHPGIQQIVFNYFKDILHDFPDPAGIVTFTIFSYIYVMLLLYKYIFVFFVEKLSCLAHAGISADQCVHPAALNLNTCLRNRICRMYCHKAGLAYSLIYNPGNTVTTERHASGNQTMPGQGEPHGESFYVIDSNKLLQIGGDAANRNNQILETQPHENAWIFRLHNIQQFCTFPLN